ncbi:MAG: hypothetical protein WCP96_15545 [Methylococcaceae bacterium]
MTPEETASHIYQAAVPILKIISVGGRRWLRNDKIKKKRTGPWLQATYEVINFDAWGAKSPCIYFIAGNDGVIRYTGILRNGAKHRWRESPAIDAETGMLRQKKELHHSQCWQHIEQEHLRNPSIIYEIRCITAPFLLPVLERLGPPLSGFIPLAQDHEGIVAALERWLCNNQSPGLVPWNISMTASRNDTKCQQLVPAPQLSERLYPRDQSVCSNAKQMTRGETLRNSIQISSEGFFTELWAINNEKIQVFPHLKNKRNIANKGLEITLTGKKEDYHLVDLEQFLGHIAKGHFEQIGRVRMKPKSGGQSNGFAVRKAMMSQTLLAEIEERQNRK